MMRAILAALAGAALVISATAAWASREALISTTYVSRMPVRGNAVVDGYRTIRSAVFFHDLALRLTRGLSDDVAKLTTLVAWTNENIRPDYAAPHPGVSDDPYAAALRGYGSSGQDAETLAVLASYAGYDARLVFAYWPDGLPHHAVTEVLFGDHWVIADAWVGTIYRSASGRLLSADEIAAGSSDLSLYRDDVFDLRAGYVAAGAVVRTYPRVGLATALSAVGGSSARPATALLDEVPTGGGGPATAPPVRAASVPDPEATPTAVSPTPAPTPDASAFEDQVQRYAQARLDQVEGRFGAAASRYRTLLGFAALEPELARSAAFFLGLALLRSGDASGAGRVFTDEIMTHPDSAWRASLLQYRGEARLAAGDDAGGRRDLAAAAVPSALIRLRALSR